MKKFIAVLTCLVLLSALLPLSLSAAGVPIDAANFPDPVFGEYIKRFDLDKSGTLSEKELSAVKELTVVPAYCEAVSSLEGIKNFSQVERVWCYCNNLTDLDLSEMANLSLLICSDNNLKTLNLSGCTSLKTLNCEYNRLTEINLSDCASITTLECSNNQLEHLDLSQAQNLETLSLFLNRISSLDLSTNQKLHYFSLSPQTVALQKAFKNGKWTADLSALVGKENLTKIIWCSAETLDTATGILTFESEQMMFTFTYQTGASSPFIEKMAVMDVKVNLYKDSAPVITANNLSFTQRNAAFDLKSEPGLGLRAADPEDGDLTADIQVQVKVMSSSSPESGANAVYDILPAVDTYKPGRYTVTYAVNDSAGNRVSLDVYVCVRDDPALYSAQSGILVNSEPQIYSEPWVSSMYNSPVYSEELSAESAVPTPPMGAQDRGTTLVLALMLACASAVLIITKRRQKAK